MTKKPRTKAVDGGLTPVNAEKPQKTSDSSVGAVPRKNSGKRNYGTPTGKSVVDAVQNGNFTKIAKLFSRDGKYWEYLRSFLLKSSLFTGTMAQYRHLIDDAINITFEKVFKSFGKSKNYSYEAGKGFFRAYLKTVAYRTAFDLLKKEFGPRDDDWMKLKKKLKKKTNNDVFVDNIENDPKNVTEELDAYDKEVLFNGDNVKMNCGGTLSSGHLVRLDEINPFSDDDQSDGYDAASLYDWETSVSEKEWELLKSMRINVFYIALCQILADNSISPNTRNLLKLLYIDRLEPGEILKLEDFASLARQTFDKRSHDARKILKRRIIILWRLVMPNGEEAKPDEVVKLWQELSARGESKKRATALRKRANDTFGETLI